MDEESVVSALSALSTDVKWIKRSLESLIENKANKWVENALKGVIGTVLLSIVGAAMAFVIGGGLASAALMILK